MLHSFHMKIQFDTLVEILLDYFESEELPLLSATDTYLWVDVRIDLKKQGLSAEQTGIY